MPNKSYDSDVTLNKNQRKKMISFLFLVTQRSQFASIAVITLGKIYSNIISHQSNVENYEFLKTIIRNISHYHSSYPITFMPTCSKIKITLWSNNKKIELILWSFFFVQNNKSAKHNHETLAQNIQMCVSLHRCLLFNNIKKWENLHKKKLEFLIYCCTLHGSYS